MKIGIVCHDAGGAHILSSFCKNNPGQYFYTLEGPAKTIFAERLGIVEVFDLYRLIDEVDIIYTGTSGTSNLERFAIHLAQKKQVLSKAFLDHWINYEMRFTFADGTRVLPNIIVVGDSLAETIAKSKFPDQKIELLPNPFWIEVKRRFDELKPNQPIPPSNICLYVSEGIQESYYHQEFSRRVPLIEYALLRALENKMKHIDSKIDKIAIRLHPSEPPDKYTSLISRPNSPFFLTDRRRDLVSELMNYNTVIGYQSMALVIGLQLGLRVISIRLASMKATSLPFEQIECWQLT